MEVCVSSHARIHLGFYTYPPDPNPWRGAGIYLSKPSLTVCAGDYTGLSVPDCFEEEQVVKLARISKGDTGIRVYGCIPPHRGLGSSTQLYLSAAMAISLYTIGSFDWESTVYKLKRHVTSRVGALLFKYGGIIVDGSSVTGKPVLKPSYTGKLPGDWRVIIVDPGGPSGPRESWEEEKWRSLPPAPAGLVHTAYDAVGKMERAVEEGDLDGFTSAARVLDSVTGEYFSHATKTSSTRCSEALDYLAGNGVYLMQSSWGPTMYTFAGKDSARYVASIIREAFELEGCSIRFLDVVAPWNEGARASLTR